MRKRPLSTYVFKVVTCKPRVIEFRLAEQFTFNQHRSSKQNVAQKPADTVLALGGHSMQAH